MIDLSILFQYNFVTPLTSLLVIREDLEDKVSLPSKGYGDLIKGLKGIDAGTKSAGGPDPTTDRVQCKTRSRPPSQKINVVTKIRKYFQLTIQKPTTIFGIRPQLF